MRPTTMVMLNLLHLAVIKICRMRAAMTQLLYFCISYSIAAKKVYLSNGVTLWT